MVAKCLVCNFNNVKIWSRVRDEEYQTLELKIHEYFICEICNVISIFPTLEQKLNEIYPSNYYSFNSDGYNFLFKIKFALDTRFFKKLRQYLPLDSVKMLDIGGGIGKLSSLAVNAFSDLKVDSTIIDLDDSAGKRANSQGHKYIKGAFEDTHLNSNYDLILAYNIIEHVPDPNAFLTKIYNSLELGGICVIQTPNYNSLDARLFKNSYWGGLHAPRHFVLFDERSLITAVDRAGLSLLEQKKIPGGPFWSYSILGSINASLKRNPGKALYTAFGYTALTGIFTAVDFIRGLFMQTSQQLIVCQRRD